MPDRFTEVTTTGYGKRITNSIGGIVVGVIIFFASFVVLYNNEGSVDYSEIAKTAVEVNASNEIDQSLNGKLLVTNAPVQSTETLGDDQFLKPGKYLVLQRDVEMYAWVEKSKSTSQSNGGGSETTTTTYEYEKKWTGNPENSSSFHYPDGHFNPELSVQPMQKKVGDAKIGIYGVEMQSVTLPTLSTVTLNTENTDLKPLANTTPKVAVPAVPATPGTPAATSPVPAALTTPAAPELVNGQYIYIASAPVSSFNAPQVGDVRVSYKVLNNDTRVTLFGKLNDKTFGPYLDPNGNRFYQMFLGTKEDAIVSLHQSYVMWKWIMRGIGFLMMWIGLSMILAPIKVLSDFVPMLGYISGSLIGLITFIASLILSGVTILAAMIFHSFVAIIICIILVGGGIFWFLKNRGNKSGPVMPGPTPASPGSQPPVTPAGPPL